ncbi:helix-turn-helix transcriptional regulator [Vibrio parahaemolyticus]|nr:helix-turn-helix transcriptional regulator [Vibrio parahaemolyticus]
MSISLESEKALKPLKNPEGIIQSELIIPFSKRLAETIGGESVRAFSRACGLSDKTLRDYLSGKTYPTLDRLALIADASGRTVNWLATGDSANQTIAAPDISGNVRVPEYDVQASAGAGSFINNEVKVGEFSFPEAWLRQKKLYGHKLCVISAWGDSMEPSIQHEDSLLLKLLDTSEKAAYDGVHVLKLDGMLLVKRMKYSMKDQGHYIISDNPDYDTMFVPNGEFDERIQIIGMVAGTVFKHILQLKVTP